MTGPGILGAFASHDFLGSLSERHRMLLASGARPFTAALGQMLAKEGEIAKDIYLVQQGQVSLTITTPHRGVVSIHTVGPGEIVGWSWLVPPHYWQFDCVATEAVQGLAFDGTWLRHQCEQDYELGYHLLKHIVTVVANRLASTRTQLLDLSK
jgi:CRP/FNR family transcriptional regulator, cyclic AMP receptor protein